MDPEVARLYQYKPARSQGEAHLHSVEKRDPKHNEQVTEPVTVCAVVHQAPFWQRGSAHEQLVEVEEEEVMTGLEVLFFHSALGPSRPEHLVSCHIVSQTD